MHEPVPLQQPEPQKKPQPWKTVKLNLGGIWQAFKGSRTEEGHKYLAFENPETHEVNVMNENGFFTLSPDQSTGKGHITKEQMAAFVAKAKANK